MQDILDLMGGAELSEAVASAGSAPRRLRQSHHLLARKLAEGASNEAASALTGYCPATIRSLREDPAFQELLAFYQSQVEDFVVSVEDRIGALCGAFLDELQHRLETVPEKFTNKELLAAFESLGDRSIAPSKGAKGATIAGPAAVAVKINFVQPPVQSVRPMLDLTPGESGV